MRVLLVEDNEMNRDMLAQLLLKIERLVGEIPGPGNGRPREKEGRGE